MALISQQKKVFPALLFCVVLLAAFVRIEVIGDWDGIFILKKDGGFGLVITDDVYAEELGRLVFHVEFEPMWDLYRTLRSRLSGTSYLNYEWDGRSGRGFIKNYFPDGTKLIVAFARAVNDDGTVPYGLFVGGGLPHTELEGSAVTRNETGMAYHNGKKWNHIWCTANEGIRFTEHPEISVEPTHWHFLGSRVLRDEGGMIKLWSGHDVVIGGMSLKMDRIVTYRAGDPYFVLSVSFQNVGDRDIPYYYLYGDEPWVGDYGSSAGDVGWVKDRLFFFEGTVDLKKYSFAGMYDLGNPVIGEHSQDFTGTANFVEWPGPNRPDLVYFSNDYKRYPDERTHTPLSSVFNRILVMQWGPRTLKPGQVATYVLALGMAKTVPGLTIPVKPAVDFGPALIGR